MTTTYSIQARDIVPGMIWLGDTVVASYLSGNMWCLRLPHIVCGPPNRMLAIQLPGPSPREMCPDMAAELSLWPVPLDGAPWRWDGDGALFPGGWFAASGGTLIGHVRAERGILIGKGDELACFYLPVVPA